MERGAFMYVGGCTKRRPIEAAEGRQSLHLTLKKRLRALSRSSPFLLPLGFLSLFFPLCFVQHLFHLLLVFFFVFARLVNASRPERTLHTQLFTSRLFGPLLPPCRWRPPSSLSASSSWNVDIFNPFRWVYQNPTIFHFSPNFFYYRNINKWFSGAA